MGGGYSRSSSSVGGGGNEIEMKEAREREREFQKFGWRSVFLTDIELPRQQDS